MIRRPPRSTLLTHSFPTRRSSDLAVDAQDFVDFFGTDIVPDTDAVHSANDFEDLAQTLIDTLVSDAVAVGNLLDNDGAGPDGFGAPVAVTQVEHDGNIYSDASDGTVDGLITITTAAGGTLIVDRSEEHTSELQSLMRIS